MSKTTSIRQQTFTAPAVADNVSVLAATTLPTSGTTVTTTGFTNPTNPRTIRFKGNQATVQGLVVAIAGTDIQGNVISENLTMGNAFATPTDTVNAYATVTSITFPTRGGASDTISVGRGAALGLDCFTDAFSFNGFSGVSSYSSDPAIISKNVVTLSATLDGTTNQAINYIPATFPAYGRIYG